MSDPLRICHVLTSLEIGGMEQVVCTLMRAQSDEGDIPSLFCTDSEGSFFDGAVANSKSCAHRKPARLVVDWAVVRKLVTFATEEHVDVLHAHNPVGQLYAVLAATRISAPVLVTYHGQAFNENFRRRLFRRLLCRRTAAVVAISEDVQTRVIGAGIAAKGRVHVIKNGIPHPPETDQSGSDTRTALGIPENAFVIGSVGRLSPEKNYSMLLRAFAGLRAESPQPAVHSQLIFVGDGPERTSLEALSRELGLAEYVKFAGARSDVESWLRAMDVFCLSSLSEGTSIALLEAAAQGLPAVVTDVGGNVEVVLDGVSGLVTPSDDVGAFASALQALCLNLGLRSRLGAAARLRVSQMYSVETMASSYRSIYTQIVGA
ncbi:MAG: glycosyltransferase family 4 protein [Phycisphaeraceae bacterium]|nr:glycosyltransferase family 4 protein [Phycisphaeraceae bacterium]